PAIFLAFRSLTSSCASSLSFVGASSVPSVRVEPSRRANGWRLHQVPRIRTYAPRTSRVRRRLRRGSLCRMAVRFFSSICLRKEVRVGAVGIPSTLDPAVALEGASALIARQVFDTLVAWKEGTTDIEPALATRWTVSRDGLTWSFTLRDNVRFHDGTALNAAE